MSSDLAECLSASALRLFHSLTVSPNCSKRQIEVDLKFQNVEVIIPAKDRGLYEQEHQLIKGDIERPHPKIYDFMSREINPTL
jgi:hypothetical protein